jgi:hypothetical protein
MNGGRIISRGTALEQRMSAACLGGRELARDAHFAPEPIGLHVPVRRDSRHLQSPAGAEGRGAGRIDRPHQVDLA